MAGRESFNVVTTFLETLQLRGEPDGAVSRVTHIQRNYPEGVTSNYVLVLGGVVQNEGEHSIDEDLLEEGGAVPLVKVEQDLTVAELF